MTLACGQSNGKAAWLADIVAQYEQKLLRMCYLYLRDLSLSEDAVQETFLKAWKGFEHFRGASQEKTWLMRIAINTCKDMRRSAWFRRIDRSAALDQLPEGTAPFTPKDDTLTRTVMTLKPRIRAVVLLHWYQQLSAEETAKALGVSRSTVYNRLNKAQKLLRRELEVWHRED